MPNTARPTEPGENLDEAQRRLTKIKPPFVSMVDAPANLQPFLVIKELTQMADEQKQDGMTFSSKVKDQLVNTLGVASQMIGDLLAMTRDAGETGQEMSGALPEAFTSKVAEVVALLQGKAATAEGEPAADASAPEAMALDAEQQTALVQALETALAEVKAQSDEIAKPETKDLDLGAVGAALKSAHEMIQTAADKATEASALKATEAAKAAAPAPSVPTTKATLEQADAFSRAADELTSTIWGISSAVRQAAKDEIAADPGAAIAAAAAKLQDLASILGGAAPAAEGEPAAAADPKAKAEEEDGVAEGEESKPAEGEEEDAETAKAGAQFSKKNRERLEKAGELLAELITAARVAPDPGAAAAKIAADAAAKKAADAQIAKEAADAEVAKARPQSRVSQPESTPALKGHAWKSDYNEARERREAAAAAQPGRK